MTQLKPPWIRADLTGIANGTFTEHALTDLLEGFAHEALQCNVEPYQLIMAFQHIQYELEDKRLVGVSPKPTNETKKPVASITPFPTPIAAAK